jgi:hypothetical protein
MHLPNNLCGTSTWQISTTLSSSGSLLLFHYYELINLPNMKILAPITNDKLSPQALGK